MVNVSMESRDKYRVFISYSHTDMELVQKLVHILEKHGLAVMWDRNFSFGSGFHEQIKSFIAHAHVFMPVITPASSERGWVHQEIGYAMALNIPVLPVTFGSLPGEMIQHLQAVILDKDLKNAEELLKREIFENLVINCGDISNALFQCADLPEERAGMMAEYANSIRKMGYYGHVRQKGGLSSFHIPSKVISDPIWKERYGDQKKSEYHCKCQYYERLALVSHALNAGCSIIINPSVIIENYPVKARLARFSVLLEFLESMEDSMVSVAINENMGFNDSITLVGNWFSAEAVSRSTIQGYKQTIFTRHAPSMNSKIELFDREMEELLRVAGWTRETSRRKTIEKLKFIISDQH